tara:strand:- start:8954 stop:9289 length:336 start_codon:yes stop_codon:yes gene_type:complete
MHPLKYIPQITHINRRQSVEDISLNYVLCEIMENLISTSLTFKMILDTHEFVYFIPIFSEKIITFTIILHILYLKKKLSTNEDNILQDVSLNESSDIDINNTWTDVLSDED